MILAGFAGGRDALFAGLGGFEFLAVQVEFLFLLFVQLLPFARAFGVFGDGADVRECALEGAFGLGLVTGEEIDLVVVGVGPLHAVGLEVSSRNSSKEFGRLAGSASDATGLRRGW